MSERKKSIVRLFAAAVLLFVVSAYRQLSMRYLPEDFLRPYLVWAVYMFLLFSWQHTITTKITQKTMRNHLTAQNIVSILYLTVRFVQDAFLYVNIPWMRFTGYFINIAAVFIPLFGFYSAFYLGKPEDYQISKKWYLLLIPAYFLSMLALTNDLHHFFYYIVPEEPQPNLYFHPYIGTYIIYLWGLWMIGHQVYVIYQRNDTTKSDPLYRKLIPFYEPILLFLFSIPYAATAYVVRFELVEYSAGLIFIIVLCWQLYILTGLIPVNTQYEEVFRRSTVAMQILSSNDERIAVSENAAEITPAMLEALKQNQHFSATEDITMNLHQIPGGYMVWQTDLSQINQALRELQSLNAELEEKRDLLAQEIRIQSDETSIQARNDIYDSLSAEVTGQLASLTTLLSKESLTADDWNRICLIGTYIKRFCNLQLTYQEQQMIPMGDLAISLQDMAKGMKNLGIQTSLDFCPTSNLEPELILLIMKTLEEILEKADFRLSSVVIQISDKVCFEITGTDREFVPRFLEGGYRLQTVKVPTGYRLLLLQEGEGVQS
ncbi:hypothetical protein OCV99_12740 [Dorea acetigenes]|uniref:Histidine kinase N-terminal 7TM region domain-containing protein n=1 Tax=Dorea acetigenes TaxID=2981787 RepID=A0ABT2RPQ4_9FIRM|nr:hypothetical protein [Dorea acetigenes]MCU6687387.1 hypothetical protein [Dorea acetigenes]SCJ39491.1 Uncharacterised protein [uncultured Clostridium sp.]